MPQPADIGDIEPRIYKMWDCVKNDKKKRRRRDFKKRRAVLFTLLEVEGLRYTEVQVGVMMLTMGSPPKRGGRRECQDEDIEGLLCALYVSAVNVLRSENRH